MLALRMPATKKKKSSDDGNERFCGQPVWSTADVQKELYRHIISIFIYILFFSFLLPVLGVFVGVSLEKIYMHAGEAKKTDLLTNARSLSLSLVSLGRNAIAYCFKKTKWNSGIIYLAEFSLVMLIHTLYCGWIRCYWCCRRGLFFLFTFRFVFFLTAKTCLFYFRA